MAGYGRSSLSSSPAGSSPWAGSRSYRSPFSSASWSRRLHPLGAARRARRRDADRLSRILQNRRFIAGASVTGVMMLARTAWFSRIPVFFSRCEPGRVSHRAHVPPPVHPAPRRLADRRCALPEDPAQALVQTGLRRQLRRPPCLALGARSGHPALPARSRPRALPASASASCCRRSTISPSPPCRSRRRARARGVNQHLTPGRLGARRGDHRLDPLDLDRLRPQGTVTASARNTGRPKTRDRRHAPPTVLQLAFGAGGSSTGCRRPPATR